MRLNNYQSIAKNLLPFALMHSFPNRFVCKQYFCLWITHWCSHFRILLKPTFQLFFCFFNCQSFFILKNYSKCHGYNIGLLSLPYVSNTSWLAHQSASLTYSAQPSRESKLFDSGELRCNISFFTVTKWELATVQALFLYANFSLGSGVSLGSCSGL